MMFTVIGGKWVEAIPKKVWTAEELEKLSPAEQQALFDQSIVRDLSEVPESFLNRIRATVLAREVKADTPKPP